MAATDPALIQKLLPHREPFLFVDDVVSFEPGRRILAQRHLSATEIFFSGHFPGRPIMPGVLVAEALAQASGLLLGLTSLEQQASPGRERRDFYLADVDLKFVSPAVPGETLRLQSTVKKKFGSLVLFSVAAWVGDRPVAKGSLALSAVAAATAPRD